MNDLPARPNSPAWGQPTWMVPPPDGSFMKRPSWRNKTVNRRLLLMGFASCGCGKLGGKDFCDANHVALLDRQSLYSSEVCGLRREGRKERGGFWDHLTNGLVPTRSIQTTSPNGQLVAVLDASQVFIAPPGLQIVLCRPDGTRVTKVGFPFNSTGEVRLTGDESIYVVGELQGNEADRWGVYRGSWKTNQWTKVISLSKPRGLSATVTGGGDSLLVSVQGQVIDAMSGRIVALGDCAQISVDGRFLYVRRPDLTPSLYTWPQMQPLAIRYEHKVGTAREWSPAGGYLLLERSILGFNRLRIVDLVSGTELDACFGRMTGQSGHAMGWIDWGPTGPEVINRFGQAYLSSITGK